MVRTLSPGGALEVQYKEGDFVKAPERAAKHGYHLLIFKTKRDALLFTMGDTVELRIWRAVYKGVVKRLPPMGTFYALDVLDELRKLHCPLWPKGTLMVKEVMLLEEETED